MGQVTKWLVFAGMVLVVIAIATRVPMVRGLVFGAPKASA